MQAAEIFVGPGLAERETIFVLGVERRGMEETVCLDDRMQDVVIVLPLHMSAHWNDDGMRREGEVVDGELSCGARSGCGERSVGDPADRGAGCECAQAMV